MVRIGFVSTDEVGAGDTTVIAGEAGVVTSVATNGLKPGWMTLYYRTARTVRAVELPVEALLPIIRTKVDQGA